MRTRATLAVRLVTRVTRVDIPKTLYGSLDSLFQWVQLRGNTICMASLQYQCILGLAAIGTSRLGFLVVLIATINPNN